MSISWKKRRATIINNTNLIQSKQMRKRIFSVNERKERNFSAVRKIDKLERIGRIHQNMINMFRTKIEQSKIINGRFFSPLVLRKKASKFQRYI